MCAHWSTLLATVVAGLVDHEVDAALHQIGRGGQADRAGADDRDGQPVETAAADNRSGQVDESHASSDTSKFVDMASVLDLSKFVNIRLEWRS